MRRRVLAGVSVLAGLILAVAIGWLYFDSFRNETEVYLRYAPGGGSILLYIDDGRIGVFRQQQPPRSPWLRWDRRQHMYV